MQAKSYSQVKIARCVRELDNTEDASFPNSYLKDEGCVAICKRLRTDKTVLTLDLRGNDIREEGASALAELVRSNDTLRSIVLEWNFLGHKEGVTDLCDALTMNRTVSHVDLRNNKIGPLAGVAIGKMLMRNHSISHLDLRWNNLQRAGGQAIVDGLQHNKVVTHVDVAGNKMPMDIVRQIGMYSTMLHFFSSHPILFLSLPLCTYPVLLCFPLL